jgi:hypothetical protein
MLILIVFVVNVFAAIRIVYGECVDGSLAYSNLDYSKLQHCFRRFFFNESLSAGFFNESLWAGAVLDADPLRLLLDAKYLNATCK